MWTSASGGPDPAAISDQFSDRFIILGGSLNGFTRDEVFDAILQLQLGAGLLTLCLTEDGKLSPVRSQR